METRSPLYDEMLELGISLADIARRVHRDRTTVQKQLTGASPLKEYVREAIEQTIAERRQEQFEWSDEADGDDNVFGGGARPESASRPSKPADDRSQDYGLRIPRLRVPHRDKLLAELDRNIQIAKLAHGLMAQHDVATIDELLATLGAQRERLAQSKTYHVHTADGGDTRALDPAEHAEMHRGRGPNEDRQ